MIIALASCQNRTFEYELRALLSKRPEASVAVSVRSSGTSLDINGAGKMHAASTMKIPIMLELFRRDHRGTLSLVQYGGSLKQLPFNRGRINVQHLR